MNEKDKLKIQMKINIYAMMVLFGMTFALIGVQAINPMPYWAGLLFCIIGGVLMLYCVYQISKLDARTKTKR